MQHRGLASSPALLQRPPAALFSRQLATLLLLFPAAARADRLSGHIEVPPDPLVQVQTQQIEPQDAAERDAQAWIPAMFIVPPGDRPVGATARAHESGEILAAECLGSTGYRGWQMALVRVARPATSRNVDLEIETAPGAAPAVQRLRFDAEQDERTRGDLRRMVANPEAVESEGFRPPRHVAKPETAPRSRPGYITGDPSLDGGGVRYLVITTEALKASFQPLVDWKTSRGVPAAIRTMEWIESRTRHGVDRAETLRNFLIEAYSLWGVDWVLLGGDTAVIPARFGWSAVFGGSTTPTDLYFACLDGTWNDDGDAFWGEGSQSLDPGEADILPELSVGRAPVNNVSEAQTFVSRVIGYESPIFTDYQNRATFLAEVLIPANWDSGQTYALNGAVGSEQMINDSVSPQGFTTQRLYDTHWLYPGSTKLTKNASIAAMNGGVGLVNQLGHGFRYTMSCGDESVVNSDADALSCGGRNFILVMANCAAASFDYNCLAERFLLNPGGGAAAVIGATRSVSASLIVVYNRAIYRQLFEHQHLEVGEALDQARLERAAAAQLDGSDRWIQFCLNVLGDPETTVWNGPIRAPQLAHPASLSIAPVSMDVLVSANAAPVAGARLCARKGDEVYAVALSAANGHATLDFQPESPGPLYLTVSGKNLSTHTDTLQVGTPTGAALVLDAQSIDDDASGASAGDGDAIIEAGETIEITLQVRNPGLAAAQNVSGTVTSADPRFTILQGSLQVGALLAGETRSGAAPVVVHVAPQVVDGTALDLPLDLHDGNGPHFSSRVHIQVCAPRPEVTRVQVLPAAETTSLAIEIKNYASGEQPPIAASVMSIADAGVEVTAGAMSFAAIAPLSAASGSPALEFIDRTPGDTGSITVGFVDSYARAFNVRIDRIAPSSLSLPAADLTTAEGTVRLTWPVSAAADHFGYHVFRSPPGGGPLTRLTPDVVFHADYYDAAVLPSTRYDYYVVDVDSSRQWSAPSPTVVVNTTAASLAGWPADLADVTSSSHAIGDLDGDGRPEVVVGDIGVYAWHANGQEIRDGDGNATTLGVFSLAPGTMLASVALGAVDTHPGLEIVAASWLTNRIDVWNVKGQELPGWPQTPANGGNTGYWASPCVADLDQNGSPEILAISKDGWLYAWHANGTPAIGGNAAVRQVGAWTQNTPAVADLDGDGHAEIIVSGSLAKVFVIRDDGTDYPGWPKDLFAFGKSSPAVGDVDGDGDLEIVLSSESDHLYVFARDGTVLPGWPKSVPSDAPDFGPSPALGDLNGDGKLEIVVCSVKNPFPQSKLFVFDWAGNTLLTKTLELNSQSSPILADLDGNGSIDIVHGGEAGALHAWNLAGQELAGFPIPVGDYIRSTPVYCDVDGDGYGDLLLAGWNKKSYAWRMSGAYHPERAPWPTFHGNAARTGLLRPQFPTPVEEPPLPPRLAVSWSPNPFNPSIVLRLEVPVARAKSTPASASGGPEFAAEPVRVAIYDPRGRLVRTLLDAPRAAGSYRVTWDGRDAQGHVLGSGVYLYRVSAAGETRTGKLTLLR